MRSEDQGTWLWLADLALIAACAALLRLPVLSISTFDNAGTWDEHAFILAAREVLLGQFPYLTFWDHKPLGSTVLIAGAMAAFGQSVEAVRILALAATAATGWALHAIAWRILPDRLTALGAALLYLVFSTRLGGIQLVTETLQAPFTAAGVLLLLLAPRQGGMRRLLAFSAAGLACGIATWVKYVPAIPTMLVGGAALLALPRPLGVGRIAALGAVFATGLLLPTLASAFAYWQAGLLDEFLFANFGFARQYIGHVEHHQGALAERLRWSSIAVAQIWPLIGLTLVVLLPASLRSLRASTDHWASGVTGLWLLGELLALGVQTRFYDHHFLSVLPPMAVLAAVMLRLHIDRLAQPGKARAAMTLAVAAVALIPLVAAGLEVATAHVRQDVPRRIAETLRRELQPGDQLYVVNYAPILYFLAGTPLPTRFSYPAFLVGPRMVTGDVPRERQRLLDSRPRFVVLHEAWRNNLPAWDPQAMEAVEAMLAQHYVSREAWTLHDARGVVRLFERQG